MRATLWLLALFAVAVASALFAGNNQGTVTVFWPPWRLDLSLNFVLLALALAFTTLYAALRALAALIALPRQAQRWRLQQKERAMHGALLDALAQLMSGRFLRSRKAAQAALEQEASLRGGGTYLPQREALRVMSHLVAADASHALQDRSARDQHLQEALSPPKSSEVSQPQELQEGVQLRAARWALDDREPLVALKGLATLSQGAARRTLALRIKLKATRLAQQTQEALETARLLGKHRAFSAAAAQSIVRGLASELIRNAHDPEQLSANWLALDPGERDMPELAIHAAQRLAELGGEPAQVRRWLEPVWQQLVDRPGELDELDARRLVRALETALDSLDAQWLARIEAAQQANPRDARLQYLAGVACMQRQLWGKAQQLLTQAAPKLQDAGLRTNAWRHLAQLAEQRGDLEAALAAWKSAAQSRG